MAQKLIIFQKIYDFIVWLFPLINKLPKMHKHVLGKSMEDTAVKILTLSISANRQQGSIRKVTQLAISGKLDELRIYIRLCKDLHFISVKQYTYAVQKLNEIARIHTGWMNSNSYASMTTNGKNTNNG